MGMFDSFYLKDKETIHTDKDYTKALIPELEYQTKDLDNFLKNFEISKNKIYGNSYKRVKLSEKQRKKAVEHKLQMRKKDGNLFKFISNNIQTKYKKVKDKSIHLKGMTETITLGMYSEDLYNNFFIDYEVKIVLGNIESIEMTYIGMTQKTI